MVGVASRGKCEASIVNTKIPPAHTARSELIHAFDIPVAPLSGYMHDCRVATAYT